MDKLRCYLSGVQSRPSLGRWSRLYLRLLATAVLLGAVGTVAADESEVMAELNKLRGIQSTARHHRHQPLLRPWCFGCTPHQAMLVCTQSGG